MRAMAIYPFLALIGLLPLLFLMKRSYKGSWPGLIEYKTETSKTGSAGNNLGRAGSSLSDFVQDSVKSGGHRSNRKRRAGFGILSRTDSYCLHR